MADSRVKRGLPRPVNFMSASPFRTTSGPFIEVPVPVDAHSLTEAKKDLEDVPFKAEVHEFPVPETSESTPKAHREGTGWFSRLFKGRAERRLREQQLTAELQDLRASYAGLLHSTEDIRERMDLEKENHKTVTKALSPFPAAVAGIEKLQTRQEEASEILLNIREKLDSTSDRDATLLQSMDSIHGGVGSLKTEVGAVHTDVKAVTQSVAEIAAGQLTASASLGDFGEKMEARFEEAAQTARENADRMEQSSDDVLLVLKQMERNSQRGLWIFASLLAVLFVVLISFSAKMSQMNVAAPATPVPEQVAAEESYLANEPAAEVLVDEFEF